MCSMTKKFSIVLLIVVAMACSRKEVSVPVSESAADTTAQVSAEVKNERPLMTLTLMDGRQLEARNLNERMLLIFFQPDCDHCQREAQQIRKRIDAFSDYQLYFISSHPIEIIKKFAVDYNLVNLPNVHFGYATVESVLNNYGAISAPSIYIYGEDGRLVENFDGEVDVEVIIKYL